MKALSLHQPWASFIAVGLKTTETRDWLTKYRGPIAIHAARTTAHLGDTGRLYCEARPGRPPGDFPREHVSLVAPPLGVIVALVDLVDCFRVSGQSTLRAAEFLVKVDGRKVGSGSVDRRTLYGADAGARDIPPADFILGDLSTGRCAWVLQNVRPLRTPVPTRGRQYLWDLDAATARRVLAEAGEPAGAAR